MIKYFRRGCSYPCVAALWRVSNLYVIEASDLAWLRGTVYYGSKNLLNRVVVADPVGLYR
jgi:hypothetical protein